MEEKRKINKSLLIGSFIFLSGLSLFSYKLLNNLNIKRNEENSIKEYYKEEKEDSKQEEIIEKNDNATDKKVEKKNIVYNYIAILRIPKINLQRGLVDINSKYNNINYNIMIHKESQMPNIKNGNFILVAHSGTARVSFFRNLHKLNLNDYVYVDYENKTYTYKIINKYEIEKTGKAVIRKNTSKSSITLITCKHNTNKQIIIVGELVE